MVPCVMSKENTGGKPKRAKRVHFADELEGSAQPEAAVAAAKIVQPRFIDILKRDIELYAKNHYALYETPAVRQNVENLHSFLERLEASPNRFSFGKRLTEKGRKELVEIFGKKMGSSDCNFDELFRPIEADKKLLMDDAEATRKFISKRVAEELVCGPNPGVFAKRLKSADIATIATAISGVLLADSSLANIAKLSVQELEELRTKMVASLAGVTLASIAGADIKAKITPDIAKHRPPEPRPAIMQPHPAAVVHRNLVDAASADLAKMHEELTLRVPDTKATRPKQSKCPTQPRPLYAEDAEILKQAQLRRIDEKNKENENFLKQEIIKYLRSKKVTITDKPVVVEANIINEYSIEQMSNYLAMFVQTSSWDLAHVKTKYTEEGLRQLIGQAGEALMTRQAQLNAIRRLTVTSDVMEASAQVKHEFDLASGISDRVKANPNLCRSNAAIIHDFITDSVADRFVNRDRSPLTKLFNEDKVEECSSKLTKLIEIALRKVLEESGYPYETHMTRLLQLTSSEIETLSTKLEQFLEKKKSETSPAQDPMEAITPYIFTPFFIQAFNEIKPDLAYPVPVVEPPVQSRQAIGRYTANLSTPNQYRRR